MRQIPKTDHDLIDKVQETISRVRDSDVVRIQNGNDVSTVSAASVFFQYSIDNIIRMRATEFVTLQRHREFFTHFNLQFCHHYVGRRYGLVLIVKPDVVPRM